jgi:hypothetical protein
VANQLKVFMNREDEKALLQWLERFVLEVYPRRVPPDWKAFRARAAELERLPEDEVYFVASEIGPALVDQVKRGPDKGFWRIDEVKSPVIFWQRSVLNDDGELLSGQLWAELDVTAQTGRRDVAPERFRVLYLELEEHVRKVFRRGSPKPYLIGPSTARAAKAGEVKLRSEEHRGPEVTLHR